MRDKFDLIPIGAGSGGIAASRRAAAPGARVLIIEGSRLGGTCVIRGCVPKKLMAYAGGFSDALREAAAFGWRGIDAEFDMGHWASAKAAEIDRLEGIYRQMLAGSKVEVVEGWAKLVGPGTVEVGGRRFSAPRVLLATGGTPASDAIPGLDEAMTSNEILDLRELPETLLVIGGGYIACEFASIMAGLGVRVTQAYRDVLPLRGFDNDLRRRLADAFEARGITLAPGVAFESLRRRDGGFELLRVDGSVLSAAAVLNATGRRPNTAGLGLDAVGVELDDKGAVRVDVDSRISVDGIWAIGDLTNRRNLTPVAIAEGRAFADSEFGPSTPGRPAARVDHRTVAAAVFTEPAIATVGLTEAQACTLGPTDVYEAEFRPMKTAFAGGQQRTYMKLVVDGLDDRVLGAHMIGTDAPEIVQSLAVALTCGARKRDFDRTIAVHPTAAEEFVLMREPVRSTR